MTQPNPQPGIFQRNRPADRALFPKERYYEKTCPWFGFRARTARHSGLQRQYRQYHDPEHHTARREPGHASRGFADRAGARSAARSGGAGSSQLTEPDGLKTASLHDAREPSRASCPSGFGSSAENFPFAAAKAGTNDAVLPIAGSLQPFVSLSAVGNLFVPPRSNRSALAIRLHRLNAISGWKIATGIRLAVKLMSPN